MLMQKIRNLTSGWVASVLLGLVIITFAVWGINFSDQGKEPAVAKINDEEISSRQFQRAYANFRQRTQQKLTEKPLTATEEILLKQQTLDQMINDAVINQATQDMHLFISDDLVRDSIKSIEVFQDEGFSREKYELGIAQVGMSTADFENQLRLDMAVQQLNNAILPSVFVSDEEAKQIAKIQQQTRNISYATLTAESIKNSIDVSDKEIEEYYSSQSAELFEPEKIKLAYLDLSVEQLAKKIEIEDSELRIYYDNNKDQYISEEQRRMDIIDIELSPNASVQEAANANEKAEALREILVSETPFKEIAEKYNDNSSPSVSFSEHGFLTQGILPDAVDDVVFSMQIGETSAIIKTDKGLHIVKLNEIEGGINNTFENLQEDLEKDFRKIQAENLFFELADQMILLTYEHHDTLEVAAENTNLPILESDFFSRNDAKGILADPRVLNAVFNKNAINKKQNSEPIEIADDRIIIFRVKKHIPTSKRPLADIKTDIIKTLELSKASKVINDQVKTILADLQQGRNKEEISEQYQFDWQNADNVERDDILINRSILRTAFRLPRPEPEGIRFGSTSIGTKDYAIVIVSKVNTSESISEEHINKTKALLQQLRALNDWIEILDQFKKNTEIITYSLGQDIVNIDTNL